MKKTSYFLVLVGVVLFVNTAGILAQEKSKGSSAAAGPEAHRMKVSSKKDQPALGQIHAMAIDASGKALFLGTQAGLFRSDSGARTWQKVALSTKPSNYAVKAIAPDPRDARTIYVATGEAGVFKSTDGGLNWKETNTGLGGTAVHALAIDPNSPSKLYTAVRDKRAGIYRTTDGTLKWSRVNDGPPAQVTVLHSVNMPTGMGGIYLYSGTSSGLQRTADCF